MIQCVYNPSESAGKQQPRLDRVLEEISIAISSTHDAMQCAAEAGYRIGSSNQLADREVEHEPEVADRIEDRLNHLLKRVHGLNDMACEIRDHLDSLV